MHWPVADGYFGKSIDYRDTWSAMTRLLDSGKARHIGVCNFSPHQMEDLLNHTSNPPAVHQMEYVQSQYVFVLCQTYANTARSGRIHPYLQQEDWIKWHEKHRIHVTAYSPLAGTNPTYDPGDPVQLLNSTVVKKIADKRSCTPAQVALVWGMARGTSVIPKTSHLERVTENFGALECVLKKKDLEEIDKLGKEHHRFNNPSDSWGVQLYEGLEDSEGKHKKHS